ncbi:hypothetical protein PAER4900a_00047 [Pseudomonas phage YMC17/07/R4900a]|nr:hypothetical protein PAER4900a_00047 [Pseudomonas phage YMC17/07/R4900a]
MTTPFNEGFVVIEHEPDETKGELAEYLYAPATYDFALPVEWVKRAEAITGQQVVPHFVWLYLPNDVAGMPAPLTLTGVHILMQLARYP